MTDSMHAYRSGAVARMLRMPVATLRIWERRYAVCQPALTASGQRLYTAAHVQRLALIRQLVGQGHAIGALARLDSAQLQAVAATHATTLARDRSPEAVGPGLQRVGFPSLELQTSDSALRRRLSQADVLAALGRPLAWAPEGAVAPVQLQRWEGLQVPSGPVAAPTGARAWGVVYRFASKAALEAYADAGALLLREPADAAAVARWLAALQAAAQDSESAAKPPSPDGSEPEPSGPRWDDETLMAFAGLSTTIACECPRHLAELLIQLRHFEAYSADCAAQSPTDAALHHHLRRTAGQARVLLEGALARVAEADGLIEPTLARRP